MTDELKSNELKALEKLLVGEDDVLFENVVRPKRFGPKFWLHVTLAVFFIFFVVLYKYAVLDRIVSPDELKESIEIFEMDSKWVFKEEVHEKDFDGIIMVPQLTFRVRNIGKRELSHVYMLSVFRVRNRAKALGEASVIAMRNGLKPGGETEPLVFTSSFGYRTSSKKAFARNSEEWRNSQAEVYAKSGSSSLKLINKFFILHRVEGVEADVKYRFQ